MKQLPGQLSIFDLDMPCGKMFPEHLAATKERILGSSSKNSAKSQTKQPMFLDLRKGSGTLVGASWGMGIPSRGECLMRDFGESPREEEESGLSQILEENVPLKYYLSAKACEGVLRRAKKRGKELPEILKTALQQQIERWEKYGSPMPLIFQSCKCVYPKTTRSLTARADSSPCIDRGQEMIVQYLGVDVYNYSITKNIAKTLNSVSSDSDHVPCVVQCYDARGNGDGNVVPTITGDHNHRISDYTAVVCETLGFNHLNGSKAASNAETLNGSPTLRSNSPTSAVIAYCYSQDAYDKYTESKQSATLTRQGKEGGGKGPLVQENMSGTIACGNDQILFEQEKSFYVVRRLTPLECCRLQGMPDWWCKDVPHSDAQEYKMWGNGMALPNALYIMEGF